MIHHIVLYKLKPEVTPARVEEMMMNTRMQLLKIPEVQNIKCGKARRSGVAVALFHRDRFRIDGQVRDISRGPHFREVHGRNHQTEHRRFTQPGF